MNFKRRFKNTKHFCVNLYSHHVSVFKVSIVLQQFPHHLNVSLLSCRDQGSPAVLHAETTCYCENSHHTPNPIDRASVRATHGAARDGESAIPTSWSYQVLVGTRCRIES